MSRISLTAACCIAWVLCTARPAVGLAAERSTVPGKQPDGPHARYTFGILGGQRQVLTAGGRLCWLNPQGEVCIAPKPALTPGGAEIAAPAPAVKLKLSGIPQALEWIDEGRTLAVGTGKHIAFVDVRDGAAPKLLKELQIAAREHLGGAEMKRMGSALYVASRRQGLLRIDVEDPGDPKPGAPVALGGMAMSLDARPDLMVVANGAGLVFLRSEGESFKVASRADTPRRAEVVRMSGDRLIVCSKEYTVFYDIADPSKLREVGEVSNRDPFFYSHNVGVQIAGDRVYVASTEGGLYVHEWKKDAPPRFKAQFSFWGNSRRLTAEQKLKYLSDNGIAGPPEKLLAAVPERENIRICAVGLVVEEPFVFLADNDGKLWALEVQPDGDASSSRPVVRCAARPE